MKVTMASSIQIASRVQMAASKLSEYKRNFGAGPASAGGKIRGALGT
jgi:hypothetical protein